MLAHTSNLMFGELATPQRRATEKLIKHRLQYIEYKVLRTDQ